MATAFFTFLAGLGLWLVGLVIRDIVIEFRKEFLPKTRKSEWIPPQERKWRERS